MKIRNMKQVGERVKEIKMKRLFRRNQIIITTLAVMIAAAGYLNYAGKRDLEAGGQVADMGSLELSDEDLMAENLAAQSETVQDILSLDNDPNDTEVAEAQTEGTDLAQAAVRTVNSQVWRIQRSRPREMMRLQAMKIRGKQSLPAV